MPTHEQLVALTKLLWLECIQQPSSGDRMAAWEFYLPVIKAFCTKVWRAGRRKISAQH